MVDTEQKTAQILQTCLEAIQSGKETIDSVVSRYPELEDELRPQLENAVWLTSRRFVLDPSPEFVHRSRQRLVARIKAEQREAAVAPSLKSSLLSLLRMPPVVLRGVVTILVVFLLLMGADQMVENTSGSIPGDPGYSVKRTVEDLTLAVSSDPGQQIVLYLEYSQRRLGEVNVLVDKSRYVDATTTLNEFEEQVRSAVSSLNSVKDSDTVHKELLAMTIQEKLSDHTRELNTLMPRVPTDTKPAVEKAMMVSSDGLVVAQSAIKRLMTIRTPQPSDVPPLSTDSLCFQPVVGLHRPMWIFLSLTRRLPTSISRFSPAPPPRINHRTIPANRAQLWLRLDPPVSRCQLRRRICCPRIFRMSRS